MIEQAVITDTFCFKIEPEKKLCILTGSGEVNFEKTLEVFDTARQHPELRSDFNILADLRTVNYHPTFEEIMTIKNKITFQKDMLRNKIALVTSGKIKILADMICAFSNAAGIRMKSFSEPEDALAWISQAE